MINFPVNVDKKKSKTADTHEKEEMIIPEPCASGSNLINLDDNVIIHSYDDIIISSLCQENVADDYNIMTDVEHSAGMSFFVV